jgi:peroxiredoxin family protein
MGWFYFYRYYNHQFKIMANKKFTMALYTGSLDKLTAAGVILSGAVADDMDVNIYVLMMGARAFKKDIGSDRNKLGMSEYPDLKNEFMASLDRLNVKSWTDFFKEAKSLSNVKVHICGLAGKMWGGTKLEDFNELVDDIVGINEYITSAQEADIHLLI